MPSCNRTTEGVPVFHAVRALQALLSRTIKRLMRLLTCKGYLIEDQRMSYLTDTDTEAALGPLQAEVVLTLKTPYRDSTTHIVMSLLEFMQRLAALVPCPRLHLIRFHGGMLALNAKRRPAIVPGGPENANRNSTDHGDAPHSSAPVRLSWARLLKRVFDIDIEHCLHCGGTLKIIHRRHRKPLGMGRIPFGGTVIGFRPTLLTDKSKVTHNTTTWMRRISDSEPAAW